MWRRLKWETSPHQPARVLEEGGWTRAEQEQPTMDPLLAWVGEAERLWTFRIGHSVGRSGSTTVW